MYGEPQRGWGRHPTLVTPLLALRKDVLPKQLTRGWPEGPPHSASSSATASSDGQGRMQEQARGAAAPPQSAAGWGCAGRALRPAAASAVVWDGASLPGSARSLLEPWQTHGTGDAPREAVSHPSHAAREELAPASRRAAGLIQCPPRFLHRQKPRRGHPAPQRAQPTVVYGVVLRLGALFDLPGLTAAASPERVRCALARSVRRPASPPAPFSKA